jgi:uncharacterized small protein (DUF1192 family)
MKTLKDILAQLDIIQTTNWAHYSAPTLSVKEIKEFVSLQSNQIDILKAELEDCKQDFDRESKAADLHYINYSEQLKINSKLKRELDQAIAERMPHDCGLLKDEIECLKQAVHDARIENSGQAAQLERKLDWEEQARKLYEERDNLAAKIKQWEFDYDHLSKQCSREVEKIRKDRDAIGVAWKEDQAQLKKVLSVKPEPSRLEIAAMIYAADDFEIEDALSLADSLIAAARESK